MKKRKIGCVIGVILLLLTLIVEITIIKFENRRYVDKIEEYNNQLISINKIVELLNSDQQNMATQLNDMILSRMNNVGVDLSNITTPSNILISEAEAILEGTKLKHLANAFVDAEQKYNINALFLMGLASHESGYGESERAINDNNYTGMGVNTSSAKGKAYNSGYDNILDTAKLLSQHYVNPKGNYYKGTSIEAVAQTYCNPPEPWIEGISSIAKSYEEKYRKIFIEK